MIGAILNGRKVGTRATVRMALMIYAMRERTDRRIDKLVYELYGLTEKEIRIVEEATG